MQHRHDLLDRTVPGSLTAQLSLISRVNPLPTRDRGTSSASWSIAARVVRVNPGVLWHRVRIYEFTDLSVHSIRMNFGRVRSDSSPRSSNGHVHGTVLFGRVFAVRPGHNSRIVFTPLLSRFIGDSEPWSVRSYAQTCTLRDSHYGTFGREK